MQWKRQDDKSEYVSFIGIFNHTAYISKREITEGRKIGHLRYSITKKSP